MSGRRFEIENPGWGNSRLDDISIAAPAEAKEGA